MQHDPFDRQGWDEIEAYLAGEADVETRIRVDAYFATHPRIEKVLRQHLTGPTEPWAVATMLEDFHERVRNSAPPAAPAMASAQERLPAIQPNSRARWRSHARLLSVSLGAAFVILAEVVVAKMGERNQGGNTAALAPVMTYATQDGQRSEITLSDGTRIVLNVASHLEIPNDFGRETRSVRLRGEAYFHVTSHEKIPFVVETEGADVRVLGTEFGVRAYDSAPVRVAVRNGRVAVNQSIVAGNEVANLAKGGRVVFERGLNVDALLGFSEGKLVLNDIPLGQAIQDLNRWYGVDIRLGSPELGAVPLHAVLLDGGIGDLVDLFQMAFKARVERNGRVLTVYAQ